MKDIYIRGQFNSIICIVCNFDSDYHNNHINLILRNSLGNWNVIVNREVVGYGFRRFLYIYFITVAEIRVVLDREFVRGAKI